MSSEQIHHPFNSSQSLFSIANTFDGRLVGSESWAAHITSSSLGQRPPLLKN